MLLFGAKKYGPVWVGGLVDGWMDGWVDGRARLRIVYSNNAYSNKKTIRIANRNTYFNFLLWADLVHFHWTAHKISTSETTDVYGV